MVDIWCGAHWPTARCATALLADRLLADRYKLGTFGQNALLTDQSNF